METPHTTHTPPLSEFHLGKTDERDPSFYSFKSSEHGMHRANTVESLDFHDVDNEVASLKYKVHDSPGILG